MDKMYQKNNDNNNTDSQKGQVTPKLKTTFVNNLFEAMCYFRINIAF